MIKQHIDDVSNTMPVAKENAPPQLVPMCDRVSNAEATTLAVVAEHSMPLSYVPVIIALAKDLAKDQKALSEVKLVIGALSSGSKASPDELKTRLLKISVSSDCGVEHGDSLSRTAKLVLAAAGPKPKIYGATSTAPGGEKMGLFSSCVDQKYGPKFHEEIGQFLAKLNIDSNDLDSITLADVRHKFEKRKKRKLTKDEKREFITMAKEFLQDMFSKKARNETTSKPDSLAKPMNPVRKTPSIDSAKSSNSPKTVTSPLAAMKSCQGKMERNGTREITPSGKRRLNNSDERVTPPCKRVLTEKIMSVKQQMKSYEQSPGAGKPKSLPESIKEKISIKKSEDKLSAKKSAGLPGNMMTPTSPFEYHGLRGADLDMSDEMLENKQSPVTKVKNMEKSKLKCSENSKKNNVKNNMKERKDNVLGSPKPNFGNFGLDMPWSPAVNENKTPVGGVSSGAKSRGKSRGRGSTRGRGRGRSIKKIAFPSDLIQDDSDDSDTCYDLNIVSPAEVKGQGRGRGKGRGRKNNKETHINSPASLEVRPAGFAKCDGCNEYFGENLLHLHQQRCQRWKMLQPGTDSRTPSSPWLSSKPGSGSPAVKTATCRSSSAQEFNTTKTTVRTTAKQSNDNTVKSPPWLLAAERRLHEQHSQRMTDTDIKSYHVNMGNEHRPGDSSNETSPIIKAQRQEIIRYETVSSNFSLEHNQSKAKIQNQSKTIDNQSRTHEKYNKSEIETFGFSLGFSPSSTAIDIPSDPDNSNESGNVGITYEQMGRNSEGVECPLCGDHFPSYIIEMHAASCLL